MLAFTTKQKELSSNRTAIHQSKGHYEMKSFASKSRSHGGGKRRPDQNRLGQQRVKSSRGAADTLEKFLRRIFDNETAETVADCLGYMCSVERSKRPSKAAQISTIR